MKNTPELDSKEIQDCIVNDLKNRFTSDKLDPGIIVLSLETGFGKTEICKRLFKEFLINPEKEKRNFKRIVFVTPRNNNRDSMVAFLKGIVKENDIQKQLFLNLVSRKDALVNTKEKGLLNQFKEELQAFSYQTKDKKIKISKLEKFDNIKDDVLNAAKSLQSSIDYIENASDDTLQNINNQDLQLQRKISELLSLCFSIENGKKPEKKERKQEILKIIKDRLSVCVDLWPECLWEEALIIVMSSRKLEYQINCPLIGDNIRFVSEDFAKGTILFRDESDANMIEELNFFAEEAGKQTVDINYAFKQAKDFFSIKPELVNDNYSVKNGSFSPALWKAFIEKIDYFYKLKEAWKNIEKKFGIASSYIKLDNENGGQKFLFFRSSGILISQNKKELMLWRKEKEHGQKQVSLIRFNLCEGNEKKEKRGEKKETMQKNDLLLSEMFLNANSFLGQLYSYIALLWPIFQFEYNRLNALKAYNKSQIKGGTDGDNYYEEMDDYAAISSVVHNIVKESTTEGVCGAIIANTEKVCNQKSRREFQVNEEQTAPLEIKISKGYNIFAVENRKNDIDMPKIYNVKVNGSPEIDEKVFAENGCVVHVSATSRTSCVVSNFSYETLLNLGLKINDLTQSNEECLRLLNKYKEDVCKIYEMNDAKYIFHKATYDKIGLNSLDLKEKEYEEHYINEKIKERLFTYVDRDEFLKGNKNSERLLNGFVVELQNACINDTVEKCKDVKDPGKKILEYKLPKMLNLCGAVLQFLDDTPARLFSYVGKTVKGESFCVKTIELTVKFFNAITNEKAKETDIIVADAASAKNFDTATSYLKYSKNDNDNRNRKVILLSNFESYSRGVNTIYDYEFSEEDEQYLFKLGLKYNVNKRDLDYLYLDDITHLDLIAGQVSGKNDEHISALVTLLLYERLRAATSISREQFEDLFRYLCMSQKQREYFEKPIYVNDIQELLEYCGINALQTIGRSDRANIKNKRTHIFVHSNIIHNTPLSLLDDLYGKEVLKPLQRDFKNFLMANKVDVDVVDNKLNNRNIMAIERTINYLKEIESKIGSEDYEFSEEEEAAYDNLRKESLIPYRNDLNDVKNKLLFIDLGEGRSETGYWLKSKGKSKDIQNKKYTVIVDKNEKDNHLKLERIDLDCTNATDVISCPLVREAMINSGYAVEFKPSRFILNFIAFKNIYQAVLGEFATKAVLEKNGIDTNKLNLDVFEIFDMKKTGTNTFIDVKNWSGFDVKFKPFVTKIKRKMEKVGTNHCVFVNFLFNDLYINEKPFTIVNLDDNKTVIIVPWLYDSKKESYNEKAIEYLKTL